MWKWSPVCQKESLRKWRVWSRNSFTLRHKINIFLKNVYCEKVVRNLRLSWKKAWKWKQSGEYVLLVCMCVYVCGRWWHFLLLGTCQRIVVTNEYFYLVNCFKMNLLISFLSCVESMHAIKFMLHSSTQWMNPWFLFSQKCDSFIPEMRSSCLLVSKRIDDLWKTWQLSFFPSLMTVENWFVLRVALKLRRLMSYGPECLWTIPEYLISPGMLLTFLKIPVFPVLWSFEHKLDLFLIIPVFCLLSKNSPQLNNLCWNSYVCGYKWQRSEGMN